MSYYDQDFWVQREAYDELYDRAEELERQLNVADDDCMFLEKENDELKATVKALKNTINALEQDIKWLEGRLSGIEKVLA